MLAEQFILSVNKLAFRVGISRAVLESVAKNKSQYYNPYTVTEKKRDGTTKERQIDNPNLAIRKIQRRINKILLKPICAVMPKYTNGSIPKRSTYHNALPHAQKEAMLLIDISNCFPSIKSTQVYETLKNSLGCSPPVANMLTKLTTYGNRLPQGAPTSPSLCNLVLAPLTAELNELGIKNGVSFTQYIDDLTFSGAYETLRVITNDAVSLIEKAGFKVNRKKLKLIKNQNRMVVTGLVVNQKVSVGRTYLRKVQRDIMELKLDETKLRGKIGYVRAASKAHARKLTKRLKAVTARRQRP